MQGQGISMSRTSGQSVPPLLVSPREAANLLGISERSLHTYTAAGTIPVVRIGGSKRYSVAALSEWIRAASEKKVRE